MRLASATLGGESIALTDGGEVNREDNRFTIQRGPIDAWYDMSLGEVEQSFRVDYAGMHAELVLNLDVETEFQLEFLDDGLLYKNEVGAVSYRHCVVYDGAGNRLQLPIQAQEGRITLTVPAEFMANAVAPVVVDPIIDTYVVYSASTRDLTAPDVAYDLTNDEFAYAYEFAFSATDHDIYVDTHDGTSGAFKLRRVIEGTMADANQPNIAGDNTSNQFLVAYRNFNSGDMLHDILGRTFRAGTSSRSPIVTIAERHSNYENFRLDVGGKSQGTPLLLVAWERRFVAGHTNIRSAFVTPAVPHSPIVAPTATPYTAVSSGTNFDDGPVRVSQSSGKGSVAAWRLCWARKNMSNGDQAMYSRVYHDDGTLSVANTLLFNLNPTFNVSDLDISETIDDVFGPQGGPVACLALYLTSGTNFDIWCAGVEDGGDFGLFRLGSREHVTRSFRPRQPACSVVARRFTVTYVEFDSTSSYKCYTTALDLTNTFKLAVNERRLRVRELDTGWDSRRPAAASRYSGGRYSSRYVANIIGDFDQTERSLAVAVALPNRATTNAAQYCEGNLQLDR